MGGDARTCCGRLCGVERQSVDLSALVARAMQSIGFCMLVDNAPWASSEAETTGGRILASKDIATKLAEIQAHM